MTKQRSVVRWVLVAALAAAVPALAQDKPIDIAPVDAKRSVDFNADILPILKTNCLACHNAKDAEGDLVLETPERMLKGGESGPAVVPGKGGESLLVKTAARLVKPHMPPPKNKVGARALSPQELGLLKAWVDRGAKGSAAPAVPDPVFKPSPAGWNPVYAAAIDPAGEYVACGRAGRLHVYHLPSRLLADRPADPSLAAKFPGGVAHADAVHAMAFSPDGALLATGGYRAIKLWAKDLAEKSSKVELGEEPKVAALSPDGSRLAVAAGNDVRIFDLAAGKLAAEVKGHADAVAALRFSPDGATLASGSADKTARTWKAADGSAIGKYEAPGPVTAVEFAGAALAAGGSDGVVLVWAAPGQAPKELKGTGAAAAVADLRAAGGTLVAALADGRLRPFAAESGQAAKEIATGAPVSAIAVSPDGKRAVALGGAAAKLWSLEDGKAVAELRTDGPARRRDAQAQALLAFAGTELTFRQGAIKAAEDNKKKEEEEVKKAADAVPAADKAAKEKEEALAKAVKDREAADAAHAELAKAAAAHKEKAEGAAKRIAEQKPPAEQKPAEAEKAAAEQALAEAAKAADAAKADPKAAQDAAKKRDAAAKAEADAKAARDAAAKKVEEAGADEAKKKDAQAALKPLEEALAKASKAREAAEAEAKKAQAAHDEAAAKAAAAAKKRDEAKARAEAAVQALAKILAADDAAKKAAAGEKTQAETAQKAAEQQLPAADKKKQDVRKAEEAAALALEQAKLNLDSAKRRVEQAKEGVTRSDQAIAAGNERLKLQQEEQKSLEAGRKAAADELAKAQQALRGAAFSADGAHVALAAADGRVYMFGGARGEESAVHGAHGKGVLAAGFAADGRLVSVGGDGSVRSAAALAAWKLRRTLAPAGAVAAPVDRVVSLAFSPDGKLLASGGGVPSRDGELVLWKVEDGSLARAFTDAHSDSIYDVAFTADGTLLGTAAADKFAKVWEVATGKHVRSFEGHTHHVLGVGWNRTGRTLSTAGADNVVKVWSLETGQQVRTIQGFDKQVTALRYLGFDDRFVVSAGGTQVRVVREAGNTERNLESGQSFTYKVAVGADGRLVAAGALDGILRVWRPETAAPMAVFEPAK
jgi:WD40 repeat protein